VEAFNFVKKSRLWKQLLFCSACSAMEKEAERKQSRKQRKRLKIIETGVVGTLIN